MLANLIKKLEIPQDSFARGGSMMLVNVSEWRDYPDRTKLLGSKVTVVLMKNDYDKITVNVDKVLNIDQEKIDNSPQPIMVEFVDFVAKVYFSYKDGKLEPGLSLKASSMNQVKSPSPPSPQPKAQAKA